MSETNQTTHPKQSHASSGSGKTTKITPELVQQVADKVYALWRRDLQIEKERAYETQPSNRWRF
jgi:hypothetical protein